MKKLLIFTLALLQVAWLGCQDTKIEAPPSTVSPTPPSPVSDMILPNAKDTTLPSGRHNLYLVKGRDQKGIFVERSDFPAGYIGMPHVHDNDLYVTILKGSVFFYFGNILDTTLAAKPYGPGSFLVIPADKPHYEWFKESCTMQIEGMGPQSTYYISQEKKEPTK